MAVVGDRFRQAPKSAILRGALEVATRTARTNARGRVVSTEEKISRLQAEDAGSLVNPLASQ